jgi:hypothetical protein
MGNMSGADLGSDCVGLCMQCAHFLVHKTLILEYVSQIHDCYCDAIMYVCFYVSMLDKTTFHSVHEEPYFTSYPEKTETPQSYLIEYGP